MDSDCFKSQEKFSATFSRTLLCISAILIIVSCNKRSKWIDVDPAFSKYVDAYTTGIVSKTTSIRIQLAEDANTTHEKGEVTKDELFNFSPFVKGKSYWLDARTIEFKPDSYLKPDQQYEVSFKLGNVTRVPDKYRNFRFSIQTVRPSFKITDEGLRSGNGKNRMFLTGEMQTADIEIGKDLEKLLMVTQNAKPLAVNWQHNEGAKSHIFTIENIERTASVGNLDIKWDG